MYEEVDEQQYSRMVRDRQEDDWIIDDGEGPASNVSECMCVASGDVNKAPLVSLRWDRIRGGRTGDLRRRFRR